MKIKRSAAVLAVAAALAGCGSTTTSSGSATGSSTSRATVAGATSTAASSTSSQSHNDADVQFAQNMITHHQQAITMADMAIDTKAGASPAVVALAQQIKAAQGPEVTTMTGWLSQWGEPVSTQMSMSGHDMGSMTMDGAAGMMSTESMNKLMSLRGKAFDQSWLQMMIEHHQGAITMSQTVMKAGTSTAVSTLAGQIVTAQQKEITTMTSMLAG